MSSLVYQTKCLLCGFTITMPGLPDADVDPKNIPGDVIQFNMKLLEHLQKGAQFEESAYTKALKYHRKHEQDGAAAPDPTKYVHLHAFQDVLARVALAQGSGIMNAYESQDPAFRRMKAVARLRLNTITRKFYFDDQMLLDAVVQLNLDDDQQAMVLTLVTAVRDALTEQGKYAPDKDAPLVALV